MPPKVNTRSGSNGDSGESSTISLQTLYDKMNELLSISSTTSQDVKLLKEEQQSICKSLDFCHEKIDKLTVDLKAQDSRMNEIDREVVAINNNYSALLAKTKALEAKLLESTRYSHRNNLIISGIPESENENLEGILRRLATTINYKDFSMAIVDAAHRMGKYPERGSTRGRPIIVKFVSRILKEDFLKKRKVKRTLKASDLGFASETTVFINESLIPEDRVLLASAREQAKVKGYDFVWTRNCKVFVRKSAGQKVKRILTQDDIDKL